MTDSTFLTRVVLRNYKSIAECNVRLHPLVFLVGPNGAGKSNFLDALRFVADALRTSLDLPCETGAASRKYAVAPAAIRLTLLCAWSSR